MKRILSTLAVAVLLAAAPVSQASAAAKRVTVSGEIIDTWCYVTEIMYGLGTAHHPCTGWERPTTNAPSGARSAASR